MNGETERPESEFERVLRENADVVIPVASPAEAYALFEERRKAALATTEQQEGPGDHIAEDFRAATKQEGK